ncbi:hypothetical protein IMCC1989_2021 [gamma proteobacterium IMCC1989]|nr:hypothetical protein IMCC1989_2021 [gamma proteobacterium IMCC1989]
MVGNGLLFTKGATRTTIGTPLLSRTGTSSKPRGSRPSNVSITSISPPTIAIYFSTPVYCSSNEAFNESQRLFIHLLAVHFTASRA